MFVQTGQLKEIGQAAIDMQIVVLLSARLQVEAWYRRHPEIDEEQIVAPLIELDLLGTGSTAYWVTIRRHDPCAIGMRCGLVRRPLPIRIRCQVGLRWLRHR